MLLAGLLPALCALSVCASQLPIPTDSRTSATQTHYWELPHEIKDVAVIGAGPNGLLQAATLLEHGFRVRLFEKGPQPGGIWSYTEKTAIPTPPIGTPLNISAYTPDIPKGLPLTKIYHEGDEGLSIDYRIREQWVPSAAWDTMITTAPPFIMKLPNIQYPPDLPWKMRRADVQRHVRQYASSVGINMNDEEHEESLSYFTRVERAHKSTSTGKWTLTLRKLTPLHDGTLKVDWWNEEFDAVAVAAEGEGDAAFIPPLSGLKGWIEKFPEEIVHSRVYRRPDKFADKRVLVVGGFVSAIGISAEILSVTPSVFVSARPPKDVVDDLVREKFHPNVTFIPEISYFGNVTSDQGVKSLQDASIHLANGTIVGGFDYIIFATGFRTSLPFLADYHNSTIKGHEEPETERAPLITDGTHLRSLHWTGHYIDDPTLAFTLHDPWTEGPYQSLGIAKVWSGKARLPSKERMWKMYPGPGYKSGPIPVLSQQWIRLFVTWLNDAALEFGGRFVAPPDVRQWQPFSYFAANDYPSSPLWIVDIVEEQENTPRREWDAYNGTLSDRAPTLDEELVDEEEEPKDVWDRLGNEWKRSVRRRDERHWAEFTARW